MDIQLVAKASIVIDAPKAAVWDALINPKLVKQYLFGADVISDWRKGSPIAWKGEWQGKSYEDKGVVLANEPGRLLQYTYFSALSGRPDRPENYVTVTIELSADGNRTRLSLTQDNNTSKEGREHSEANWRTVLESMKKLLEA